jgi:hypothetical protein
MVVDIHSQMALITVRSTLLKESLHAACLGQVDLRFVLGCVYDVPW